MQGVLRTVKNPLCATKKRGQHLAVKKQKPGFSGVGGKSGPFRGKNGRGRCGPLVGKGRLGGQNPEKKTERKPEGLAGDGGGRGWGLKNGQT